MTLKTPQELEEEYQLLKQFENIYSNLQSKIKDLDNLLN